MIAHESRIVAARLSLDGLSTGDAFGERFFGHPSVVGKRVAGRTVPPPPWPYTDDTEMAMAIVESLVSDGPRGKIDQDRLAARFAERYREHPDRGYGATATQILDTVAKGVPWRVVSRVPFDGQGSMGNGGAMRSAPIGAYFADDLTSLVACARASAEITHAHAEGQAGAVAVALGAAWAWNHRNEIGPMSRHEFLEFLCVQMPKSATADGIEKAFKLPANTSVEQAVELLGNGRHVLSADTVPFALWCASHTLGNFTEAMWKTVSGLGDRDTTCAIVGGIVALSAGRDAIPKAWLTAREELDLLGL